MKKIELFNNKTKELLYQHQSQLKQMGLYNAAYKDGRKINH
jgi:hypothetical protein